MTETGRLIRRPLSRDDLPAFAAFLGDPQATAHLHTPDLQTNPAAGFVGFVPKGRARQLRP